ncbi:6714_t:CDS:2, partial [Cetraspora pellucida]
LEETALNEINQLIGSLDKSINDLISILEEELNEQNLFEKLNNILEKLSTYTKLRENQIKTLEAYYYLGTLIQENETNQEQIREQIQKTNGAYKARDIWKGACHIQKIFTLRPKAIIYQTKYLAATQV